MTCLLSSKTRRTRLFLADVVMRASSGSVQTTGRTVAVPANSRVEVRFPVHADAVGALDVQCAVAAFDLSDAATLSIPGHGACHSGVICRLWPGG